MYLLKPTKEHEQMIMEYRREHNGEHINGSNGLTRYDNYDEWLTRLYSEPLSTWVPADTYMSMIGDRLIGMVQLRHRLNERLEKSGGHIGYGIRPTERGKGYGTRQLSLVLNEARKLQIPKVMISCDSDNPASAKVAMKNGGIMTWEGYCEEDKCNIQIYWIDLQS